jgi:VWFA-related protein
VAPAQSGRPAAADQAPPPPQTTPPQTTAPQAPPTFRSATSLVLVRFHVVRKNRYVDTLNAGDVVLLEDGVERPFDLFEGGRSATRTIPIEMSIVVDTSGSVVDQGLLDPMAYKRTLLDSLPGVSLSVYGFARNARRYCTLTRDPAVLGAAFAALRADRDGEQPHQARIPTALPPGRSAGNGASWIFESVLATARDASASPGPATRLLLVFTDAQPTTTTHPGDILPALQAIGIPVYPVVLGHREIIEEMREVRENGFNSRGELTQGARTRLYRLEDRERRMRELALLGEMTGGRSFDPPTVTLDIVRTILATMTATVVSEYVVGFSPERSASAPKPHKIEVKLRSKDTGALTGGKRTVSY